LSNFRAAASDGWSGANASILSKVSDIPLHNRAVIQRREIVGTLMCQHGSVASEWLENALFAEVLCHNCATKPDSAAKTDFIDDLLLLILRNLLKTKRCPKIPAYRLARFLAMTYRTVLVNCAGAIFATYLQSPIASLSARTFVRSFSYSGPPLVPMMALPC